MYLSACNDDPNKRCLRICFHSVVVTVVRFCGCAEASVNESKGWKGDILYINNNPFNIFSWAKAMTFGLWIMWCGGKQCPFTYIYLISGIYTVVRNLLREKGQEYCSFLFLRGHVCQTHWYWGQEGVIGSPEKELTIREGWFVGLILDHRS